MYTIDWIIASSSILLCCFWTFVYLKTLHNAFAITVFEDEHPLEPRHRQTLSIVIAACDEADTIEQAVSTLLLQDYPGLEIILVNDRSADETGAIIDKMARKDERVRPVHIEKLPEEWIGKVHALHVGARHATGDWILFTDADVHFSPDILRRAVSYAVSENADHLALLPDLVGGTFMLNVAAQTFGLMFLFTTRAAEMNRPGSNAFVGVGAFNLVRRSVFEKTKGFEWLRMEIVDDVGLGLLMHNSGARSRFAVAARDISVAWYPTVRSMFRGLEKNLFGAVCHYSLARMALIVLTLWALVAAPLTAILYTRVPYLWIAGVLVYALSTVTAVLTRIRFKKKQFPPTLIQLGHLMMSLMILRSGVVCAGRGKVVWRGTAYTIDQLRAGQRVRL